MPTFEGMKVVYPTDSMGAEQFDLDIPSGGDHIIVLRRLEGASSYKFSYLAHPREMSDEEMVEECKEKGEEKPFEGLDAKFLIHVSERGTTFFFENLASEGVLKANFELNMTNLRLQGAEEGANTFEISLEPGATDYRICRRIEISEG